MTMKLLTFALVIRLPVGLAICTGTVHTTCEQCSLLLCGIYCFASSSKLTGKLTIGGSSCFLIEFLIQEVTKVIDESNVTS